MSDLTSHPMKLLTITEAAEALKTTRFKIWYAIKAGFWKPKHFYGNTYFVDVDGELELLEIALKSVGTRSKSPQGKYLAGENTETGEKP